MGLLISVKHVLMCCEFVFHIASLVSFYLTSKCLLTARVRVPGMKMKTLVTLVAPSLSPVFCLFVFGFFATFYLKIMTISINMLWHILLKIIVAGRNWHKTIIRRLSDIFLLHICHNYTFQTIKPDYCQTCWIKNHLNRSCVRKWSTLKGLKKQRAQRRDVRI